MANKKQSNVVQLSPDWRSAFQGHAMRSSFCLALTQPMLEFLCATADGVQWDRALYYQQYGSARPSSDIASSSALVKRGLIEEDREAKSVKLEHIQPFERVYEMSWWKLTPAGVALVELLKVAGIFIEADASQLKRQRAASGEKR